MAYIDYYKILGVNKDASQDPIGKYWIEDRTDPQNPKGAN